MNGMIAWWARNPIAANLLMVGIILAGLLGYQRMEREFFPTIRVTVAEVTVAWPGAAPQEVEEQIVLRIEEALTDMDGIDRLYATAQEGFAGVWVDGKPRVDRTQFINDVKARIDSISSFPRDIEPPRVREIVAREEMIRIAVHGDAGERSLKRIAEQLRDEVALLPGISVVNLFGTRREEVSIELSEDAMRRFGVSFDEVAAAIRGSSINLSSGRVRTDTGDVQLSARNQADNQADFENIVVRQSDDGALIRVRDVARVIDGFEDEEILATLNGEPAALVQVMTAEQSDVVAASRAVREWLPEARQRMPRGVELTLWWDTADVYNSRIETIGRSAVSGLALVCLILLLTLRPRVALWVSVGIATAYAGAFVFLPDNGVSINMISTFAFLLVLGIVVDDAIIVGESIYRTGKTTPDTVEAAILGTQLVAKPVVFAVLTTIIAFMPWLFLSGESAQITRQISLIILFALSFSLVEALFILPAHLSQMKPRSDRNRFFRFQHRIEHSLTTFADRVYRGWVTAALRHHYLTAAIFIAVFMISVGFVSSGWLKFSFMPDIEGDQIIVNVDMADGAPYSRALEVLDQLQRAEKALVEEVDAMEGGGGLVENWYTRSRRDSVIAIVKLVPPEDRQLTAKEAAERLRELVGDIPDADAITVNHSLGGFEPDIEYSVSHDDLDVLRAAVRELKEKLRSYDALYDVRDNLQAASEELRFSLRPGAAQLGLTLADVSRQVRQAYYGEEAQRLAREGSDVKVMVRYPRETRRSLDSLGDFRVRLPDGREVPLLAVAEIEHQPGINRIDRRERKRAAVVSAEMVGEVRHDIHKDLEENFFDDWKRRHPGVILGAIGQAEGEQEFIQEVTALYAIALFAMYALIAVAFKSYWHPLVVMTAIPFGFMGAVYGHLLFGVPMALFSYFGIGAAAGVVVNDNLVLLSAVNRYREQGMAAYEAVIEAGVTRFRPILLTSVTTFVGLVPMMAERSIQAQFLIPTVISLAFGVLFTTFVTLLLVPALYAIGEDLAASWQRLRGRRQDGSGTEPAAAGAGD
jgi:multidrug efflux pump subunit AcrB